MRPISIPFEYAEMAASKGVVNALVLTRADVNRDSDAILGLACESRAYTRCEEGKIFLWAIYENDPGKLRQIPLSKVMDEMKIRFSSV